MASAWASYWRYPLPWTHGYQRCHLPRPPLPDLPRRHPQHLRAARACLLWPHRARDVPLDRRDGHLPVCRSSRRTPGYISRSVAGSYDNEAIAIFLLVFTFYLWIKAVKNGSMFWGALTALFYGYMVSAWGGYVFITNLLPLHAFVLICMGRYSPRLYVSYTSWYALGTLASMQIPFVGFLPIRSSEHMSALGK
jgi:hypothetical protein